MRPVGEWVQIKRTWHDTTLTNCTVCGRLVPRRVWLVEFGGRTLPFCNEECEELYRSYWLPKYGGGADEGRAAAPESSGSPTAGSPTSSRR
jgi:hypothetical protein